MTIVDGDERLIPQPPPPRIKPEEKRAALDPSD